MTDLLKTLCAGAGALLSYCLGGFDALLLTLVGFCAGDYVTGLLRAIFQKNLQSRVAFVGGLRKMLIFAVVAVAVGVDRTLGQAGGMFRGMAIGYYIAAEALSILENASACGLPLPARLVGLLKQSHDE